MIAAALGLAALALGAGATPAIPPADASRRRAPLAGAPPADRLPDPVGAGWPPLSPGAEAPGSLAGASAIGAEGAAPAFDAVPDEAPLGALAVDPGGGIVLPPPDDAPPPAEGRRPESSAAAAPDPGPDAPPEAGAQPPAGATAEPGATAWKSHYGWRQIAFDAKYIVTRPAHMGAAGWWKVGATFGVTAILYATRYDIRDWSQDHRSESGDRFFQDVRTAGKGFFIPFMSLSFYLASFAADKARERETAVMLLESMGYSGAAAGLGQFILASDRPSHGSEVHFFAGHGHGISGDAAIAAAISAPLHGQYLVVQPGDSRTVRFWKHAGTVLVYGVPMLVAYQRVNSNQHYAPDAFLGVVSGFTMGQLVVDAHQAARGSERRLSPFFGDHSAGVMIQW